MKLAPIIGIVVGGLIWLWFAQQAGLMPHSAEDNVEDDYRWTEPAWTFMAEITGYCKEKCCTGKWADGRTANGHKIQKGDKFCAGGKGFQFGTVFDVPGYGKVPLWDRGGAIGDGDIDLYFESHEEALEWGRQRKLVTVHPLDRSPRK